MQIRKLNCLRGLAALIVFITHFSDITGWLGGKLGGAAGQYGVMLFFLLSGFLMSHLYFDRGFNLQNIQGYILARMARILPLYLLVVCASYLLSINGTEGLYAINSADALISHLLFLSGESVLWTISPEVQFYLLFVGFWALAAKRAGYIYVLVVAVLIALFFANFPRWVGEFYGVPYNLFQVLRSLPYFFVGMLFGMHYKHIKVPDYLQKHGFVLVLVLIPLMFPAFSPIASDAKTRMWLSYEVLLVMSAVFFCVVFLVPNNNILLANKLGDYVGQISFSLYLLHMPIIAKVNQYELAIELKLVVSVALSLLVASLCYRYFEMPAARLIRNWANTKPESGPVKQPDTAS
ncbi:acyltransferase [Bowmanella denitrificans]|uniref:Acyltransferase n=1 Tax=Bowmanella denitrificans TaxID=366582 RepID=A0ABN0XC28_9ALTE